MWSPNNYSLASCASKLPAKDMVWPPSLFIEVIGRFAADNEARGRITVCIASVPNECRRNDTTKVKILISCFHTQSSPPSRWDALI